MTIILLRGDAMLAYVFVILAVAIRFLPHPFSFTPVGAALLFFGARGPRKQAFVPVLLLAASDIFLTRVRYGYTFTADQLAIWAWYAAIIAMGFLLRRNSSPARIAGASLVTAVSFFAISNFAVWAVWNMYPHNFGGLMACYVAAIPFFRNEVISDVLFTAVLFSIPAVIAAFKPGQVREAA